MLTKIGRRQWAYAGSICLLASVTTGVAYASTTGTPTPTRTIDASAAALLNPDFAAAVQDGSIGPSGDTSTTAVLLSDATNPWNLVVTSSTDPTLGAPAPDEALTLVGDTQSDPAGTPVTGNCGAPSAIEECGIWAEYNAAGTPISPLVIFGRIAGDVTEVTTSAGVLGPTTVSGGYFIASIPADGVGQGPITLTAASPSGIVGTTEVPLPPAPPAAP